MLFTEGKKINDVKKRLMLMESANDYCDYVEYEKELLKVDTALDNRLREDEDITNELEKLAYEYKVYYEGHIKDYKDMADEAALSEKQAHDMLEEAENNHKNAEKDCAVILGLRDNMQEKIRDSELKQKELCNEYGVLVADTAQDELARCNDNISAISKDIEDIKMSWKRIQPGFIRHRKTTAF